MWVKRVLIGREQKRVRIQAERIGCNLVDRKDCSDPSRVLDYTVPKPVIRVTIDTQSTVKPFASGCKDFIYRKWIAGRGQRPDPFPDAMKSRVVQSDRRCAGS